MKEVSKETIEAHKKAFEDLVLWINRQYENEIKILLPKSSIVVKEWFSRDNKELIQGASVHLTLHSWYDSELMEYLMQTLGAKSYRVNVLPLCRLSIVFKVSISNPAKLAMQCTGMWKPKFKKNGKS